MKNRKLTALLLAGALFLNPQVHADFWSDAADSVEDAGGDLLDGAGNVLSGAGNVVTDIINGQSVREDLLALANDALLLLTEPIVDLLTNCENNTVHGIKTQCFSKAENKQLNDALWELRAQKYYVQQNGKQIDAYNEVVKNITGLFNMSATAIKNTTIRTGTSDSDAFHKPNGSVYIYRRALRHRSPVEIGALLFHESQHKYGEHTHGPAADKNENGPYGAQAIFLMNVFRDTSRTSGRKLAHDLARSIAAYAILGADAPAARDRILGTHGVVLPKLVPILAAAPAILPPPLVANFNFNQYDWLGGGHIGPGYARPSRPQAQGKPAPLPNDPKIFKKIAEEHARATLRWLRLDGGVSSAEIMKKALKNPRIFLHVQMALLKKIPYTNIEARDKILSVVLGVLSEDVNAQDPQIQRLMYKIAHHEMKGDLFLRSPEIDALSDEQKMDAVHDGYLVKHNDSYGRSSLSNKARAMEIVAMDPNEARQNKYRADLRKASAEYYQSDTETQETLALVLADPSN